MDQKNKKIQKKFFDRQIQIFGEEVQSQIIKTQVQVFSCDSTSSEVLKNLVLIGFNVIITSETKFQNKIFKTNPLIYPEDKSTDGLLSSVIKKKLEEFSNFNQVKLSKELESNTKIIICAIKNKKHFYQCQERFKDFDGLIIYFTQRNYSLVLWIKQKKLLNEKFFEGFKNSENLQFQDFYKKFQSNENLFEEPEIFIVSICGSFINQTILQYMRQPELTFSAICLNLGDYLDNPVELNSSFCEFFEY